MVQDGPCISFSRKCFMVLLVCQDQNNLRRRSSTRPRPQYNSPFDLPPGSRSRRCFSGLLVVLGFRLRKRHKIGRPGVRDEEKRGGGRAQLFFCFQYCPSIPGFPTVPKHAVTFTFRGVVWINIGAIAASVAAMVLYTGEFKMRASCSMVSPPKTRNVRHTCETST